MNSDKSHINTAKATQLVITDRLQISQPHADQNNAHAIKLCN